MLLNYIVSHKIFPEYYSNYSKIMWVGSIGSEKEVNDRGSGSIWKKNQNYCELTALHKIWKNLPERELHIGFSHYRRQLLLKKIVNEEKLIGQYSKTSIVPLQTISSDDMVYLDPDDFKILNELDLVLPCEENIQSSIKQHFIHHHGSQSWSLMIGVLKKNGEKKIVDWLLDDQNHSSRWGNLFLLRKCFLEDFCQWIFPLLEEMEKEAKQIQCFREERIYGFIAERMFSAYFNRLIRESGDILLVERPTLLIDFENQELWNRIDRLSSDEQLWIWGAGSFGEKFLNGLRLMGLEDSVLGFIDSSANEEFQTFSSLEVRAPNLLFNKDNNSNRIFIVVASSQWAEISDKLKSEGRKEFVDYYCLQGFS